MVLPLLPLAIGSGIMQGIGAMGAARAEERAAERAFDLRRQYGEQAYDRQRTGFLDAGHAQVAGARRAGNALAHASRAAGQDRYRAADQQLDLAGDVLGQQRSLFQPAATAGNNALGAYSYEMGLGQRPAGYDGFQATPGYDFRMQQGLDAITGNAAASGSSLSGAANKALMGYGQNLASEEYGTYMDRLGGLVSTGQNAAGAMGNALANYGASAGQAIGARGDALAGIRTGVGAARAGRAASVADARANMFGNIGNAGAASSYYIGDAGGQAQEQIGNARAAGWMGVSNAFSDAMGNVAGIQSYQNGYGAPATPQAPATGGYQWPSIW